MRLHGFVEVGRVELLLTLVSVGLLGVVLGYGFSVLVRWIKAPTVTPQAQSLITCTREHMDDGNDVQKWLNRNRYMVMPREVFTKIEADLARFRNRPTAFVMREGFLSKEDKAAIEKARQDLADNKGGRHRRE